MLSKSSTTDQQTPVAPAGHYRWVIVALLFVVTTINYMDRNLLGVLKPTIQGELHFSESEFGQIVFAFSIAYAIGYASMGAFTDKVGVRIGLAVAWPLRPMAWSPRLPGLPSPALCSDWVRAATSRPASSALQLGSRCGTAPSPQACSTREAILAVC